MRGIRAALAAGLLAHGPALAQPAALAEGARALQAAEAELRDTLRRMDEGGLPGSLALSRLRQAMNEVERAMLRMPAEARQGAPWQTAVKEVAEAMQALREDGADPAAARTAAGEALGTLPALRGEETGSEGG
jgi:predicted ATPase